MFLLRLQICWPEKHLGTTTSRSRLPAERRAANRITTLSLFSFGDSFFSLTLTNNSKSTGKERIFNKYQQIAVYVKNLVANRAEKALPLIAFGIGMLYYIRKWSLNSSIRNNLMALVIS